MVEVPVIVTVPLRAVKVPLLAHDPANSIAKLLPDFASRVLLALIVTVPVIAFPLPVL